MKPTMQVVVVLHTIVFFLCMMTTPSSRTMSSTRSISNNDNNNSNSQFSRVVATTPPGDDCSCSDCQCLGSYGESSGLIIKQCFCTKCPIGLHNSQPGLKDWCRTCGDPSKYCVDPSDPPSSRGNFDLANDPLNSFCTYFDSSELTGDDRYSYHLDKSPMPEYYEANSNSDSKRLNLLVGPSQLSEELYGGMRKIRNARKPCGALSFGGSSEEEAGPGDSGTTLELNETVTFPSPVFSTFRIKNPGELRVNMTFTRPNFVTITPQSNVVFDSSADRYVLSPGENVAFELEIRSGNIPIELRDEPIVIQAISTQYWSQVPSGDTEPELPRLSIIVNLEQSDRGMLLLPERLEFTLESDEVVTRSLTILNVRGEGFNYGAQVQLIDTENPDDPNLPFNPSWITIEEGDENGLLEDSFTCEGGDLTPQVDGISAELPLTLNASNMFAGVYSAFVEVIGGIDVPTRVAPVRLTVLPGPLDPTNVEWELAFDQTQTVDVPVRVQVRMKDKYGASTSLLPEQDTPGDGEDDQDDAFFDLFYWLDSGTCPPATEESSECDGEHIKLTQASSTVFQGEVSLPTNGTWGIDVSFQNNSEYRTKNSPGTIDVGAVNCEATDANSIPDQFGNRCYCVDGYGQTGLSGFAVTCQQCSPGEFDDVDDRESSCQRCPVGFFQDESGATSCKRCSSRVTTPSNEQDTCVDCPANRVVLPGDETWSCTPCDPQQRVENEECTCRPELAKARNPDLQDGGSPCVPCPTGAYCRNRYVDEALPLEGYWRVPWKPDVFRPCRGSRSACPGVRITSESELYDNETATAREENYFERVKEAANAHYKDNPALAQQCAASGQNCEPGFTGPLCYKCDIGYTRSGRAECTECLGRSTTIGLLAMGMTLALLLVIFIIREAILVADSNSREIVFAKILLSHLQVFAMAASFAIPWPPFLMDIYFMVDFISSAGQRLFSMECMVNPELYGDGSCLNNVNSTAEFENEGMFDSKRLTGFFYESLFVALVPLVFALLSGMFWFGLYLRWKIVKHKGRGRSFFAFWIVSNLVLSFLMLPLLARQAFAFYSCSTESMDGFRFLEADPNIVCDGKVHRKWAYSLGLLMVLLYTIGIPLITLLVLFKFVGRQGRYRLAFGFVFRGYKIDYFYWETVVSARKIAFALASVALVPLGADLQAYVGILILAMALTLQLYFAPYKEHQMNRAEGTGLCAALGTIYLGMYIASDNVESNLTVSILSGFIIALNLGFVLYVIKQLYRVLKEADPKQTLLQRFRAFTTRSLLPSNGADAAASGAATSVGPVSKASAVPDYDQMYSRPSSERRPSFHIDSFSRSINEES